MTRNLTRALLASVALFATGPVWAVTLADALVTAYQTSPLLDSSRASLRALDENVPQARSNLRPQVSANAAATGASNVQEFPLVPTYAAQLQATLLLFDSGQTKAALESARYGVAAGRASLLNVEQEVLFAAVTAYMDVVQAEAFVGIARNDVKVLGEQLDATNNRFEVGEVTRTDVSQTEARLAQSRANLVDAEGNLQIARQAYLAAVGVLPNNLEAAPPHPELPKNVKDAEAIGVRQNPAIVAARFAERGAVSDFDRARAASGVTIQGTAAVDYAGRHSLGANALPSNNVGDRVNLTVGVGAQVPLYTGGRNSSLIRQAQQVLEQRKFDVQDAGRQVIEQVHNAWTQRDVAAASIVANKEQVRASQIAFEGVTEEARLGARSTLDVLDSDQERLRAQAEVLRAQRDEYVAAYGVLRAMGLLTVEHLGLGIESYNPDTYFTQVQRAPVGGYDTSVVDRIRARWGAVSKRDDSGGGLWGEPAPDAIADVLASIRALVSAEASARMEGAAADAGDVILLTQEMRVDLPRADVRAGEILSDGLDEVRPRVKPAPIFDEAALRDMINEIVRDELQGELGERINRNLRKLIRREIGEIIDEAARRE